MDFEQLPGDWPALPLDDPDLAAGVVDLCTSERDRRARCLTFLLLDDGLRLVQPVCVSPLPRRATPASRRRVIGAVAQAAAGVGSPVVLGVGWSAADPLGEVGEWVGVAAAVFAEAGVCLVGAYRAGAREVVAVEIAGAA